LTLEKLKEHPSTHDLLKLSVFGYCKEVSENLRGAHVAVIEKLTGQMVIKHQNRELEYKELLAKDKQEKI